MPEPKSASNSAARLCAVVGAPALSSQVSAPGGSTSDETIRLCKFWLAHEAKTTGLARRWSEVETYLAQNCRWFDLSEAEQSALPEAAELWAIDARLERLSGEAAHIIPMLPSLAATNRMAILLKFKVLAHVLKREDYADEHALLRSALLDLEAAWL